MKPYISVVIPVYNAAEYLSECLESVLKQGVESMEVICVNDGSSDESLSILRSYERKDPRFQVIDVPNGGYGKAMNLGLDAANGKYFAILEPDDYLNEGAYAWMLKLAEEHDLDFIKGDLCDFFVNSKGEQIRGNVSSSPCCDEILCVRDEIKKLDNVLPATVCALYKMEFLRKWGIRYNETPGASYQDVGFFLQTFAHADRAMFKRGLVYLYRRDNPYSSSNTIGRKPFAMRDEYSLAKISLERYPEKWEKIKKFYLIRRMRSHRWMYSSIKNSVKVDYLNDFRNELIGLEDISREDLPYFDKRAMEKLLISVNCYLTDEGLQELKRQLEAHNQKVNTTLGKTLVDQSAMIAKQVNTLEKQASTIEALKSDIIALSTRLRESDRVLTATRKQLTTAERIQQLSIFMPRLRWRYQILRLKKTFSFGRRRERYKQKIKAIKPLLREYKELLRGMLDMSR